MSDANSPESQVSEQKPLLERLINDLRQQRDELQVQMHLAGLDAKDEFGRLKKKLNDLEGQYEPVSDAVEESVGNVFAALQLAGEEMLHSFDRVRKAITDSE